MRQWPDDLHRLIRNIDFTIPEYNQRSFRGPQGYQTGIIGEHVIMDFLNDMGIEYEEIFSTKHDLKVQGETWEIKTKERTVYPKPYYDCTVPDYNHEHQRPDRFVFVNLRSTGKSDDPFRFQDAQILGTVTLEELEQRATFRTVNDAPDDNGWVPTVNCWNLRIDQLQPL